MKKSGIYRIVVNTDHGLRVYIGQARNIHVRWVTHLWRLRSGTHRNPALQSAFDKYGESKFWLEVILICAADKDILTLYEQAILDFQIGTFGERSVYNAHKKCVSSRLGVTASESTKRKMSASLKGKKYTHERLANYVPPMLGRKHSAKSIALRTAKQKGMKRTPETIARLSAVNMGRRHSPKTRAAISAGRKGWVPSEHHIEHLRRLATDNSNPEKTAKRLATRRANAAVRGYW